MDHRFEEIIKDIKNSREFQGMKEYIHHGHISTYNHSIMVSYFVYLHYKNKKTKYPLDEIVRGALLHDYYLYDWHNKGEGHRLHGLRHPYFAYRNAKRDFEVTPLMRDIITHHMFPLVIIPPKTKPGWVVSYYDKVVSHHDYKRSRAYKKRRKGMK